MRGRPNARDWFQEETNPAARTREEEGLPQRKRKREGSVDHDTRCFGEVWHIGGIGEENIINEEAERAVGRCGVLEKPVTTGLVGLPVKEIGADSGRGNGDEIPGMGRVQGVATFNPLILEEDKASTTREYLPRLDRRGLFLRDRYESS